METPQTIGELIPIKEENGRSIVDARKLHAFLGNRRKYVDWIEQRIKKYGFVENQDFTSFHNFVKRDKGATTTKEYAITLDMAKELCMVENNAKGREARLYFIQKEKEASGQIAVPQMSQMQILQQIVNNAVEQERKNKALEQATHNAQTSADTANARIDAWESERQANKRALEYEELSTKVVPQETTRSKVCALMYKYSKATNTDIRDAWHKLYDDLYRRCRISLKARRKDCDKKLIDTAERTGCIDEMYDIASEYIRKAGIQNVEPITV